MLLVGSSSSRRATLLGVALARRGGRLAVLEWRELLDADADLQALISAHRGQHAWCKIETPGDDVELDSLLIRRGAALAGVEPPAPLSHGELAVQHLRFRGLADVLAQMREPLAGFRLLNGIDDIISMCDKLACQRRLQAHGVAIPPLLGDVTDFDSLEAQWPSREHPALFVKARYGSSAAGVVALRRHPDGRVAAYSSARRDAAGRIHNHLRVMRYTDRALVKALIDSLARQHAYAETWITKPRLPNGRDYSWDLRLVTASGRARQRIARLSRSPMTNLHLGNRRAAPDWLSDIETGRLEATALAAARAFPASHSIGFDIHPGSLPRVLEANAFGDLLPGLLIDGASTYDDQAELATRDEVSP
jgi:hypothetical protein